MRTIIFVIPFMIFVSLAAIFTSAWYITLFVIVAGAFILWNCFQIVNVSVGPKTIYIKPLSQPVKAYDIADFVSISRAGISQQYEIKFTNGDAYCFYASWTAYFPNPFGNVSKQFEERIRKLAGQNGT